MRRSELLFILFLVILKFWRFIFWKTQKFYMMSSCMTKLEFPPEPYMVFRLGKLPLIYATCFALSLVKLCWPLWEVCHALKIKITYTPHTHIPAASTLGVRKTCLSSRSTKKCFTPTLGVNTKTCLIGFSINQINAQSPCCYLSKFYCRKEAWAMQKSFIKKEKRKKWWWEKMDTKVLVIYKTMGT